MNTPSEISPAACADAWLAIRRVFQTFGALCPGAGTPQRRQMIKEWATLAAVPPAVIESTFYGGEISREQDARRILATACEMERRIAANALPSPRLADAEMVLPGFAIQ